MARIRDCGWVKSTKFMFGRNEFGICFSLQLDVLLAYSNHPAFFSGPIMLSS